MVIRVALIFISIFSSVIFADENQSLLDELWANRVLASENIKPGIVQLEENGTQLNPIQKSSLENLKAYIELLTGDVVKAIKISDAVIQTSNDYDQITRAKNIQVSALAMKGELKESFILMYQLLDDLEKIQSDDIRLNVLHTSLIRLIYSGIYDKALELSKKNIAISRSKQVNHYYCLALIEAANIELALENIEQAKSELLQAKSTCSQHETYIFNDFINYKLARIEFLNGHYLQAKLKLQKLLESNKNADYKVLTLEIAVLLAEVQMKISMDESILALARPVFNHASQYNYLFLLKDSSRVLADYYKKKGNNTEFNKYKNIYRSSTIEINKQSNQRIAEYYYAIQNRQ